MGEESVMKSGDIISCLFGNTTISAQKMYSITEEGQNFLIDLLAQEMEGLYTVGVFREKEVVLDPVCKLFIILAAYCRLAGIKFEDLQRKAPDALDEVYNEINAVEEDESDETGDNYVQQFQY